MVNKQRTLQSQYKAFNTMSIGTSPYGAEVLAEFDCNTGTKYALMENRQFVTYPRIKTKRSYSVRTFTWDGQYWMERTYTGFTTKAEATRAFKRAKEENQYDEHYAADLNSNR